MRVLCGYIDLNTCICGSTRIHAGIVAHEAHLLAWSHGLRLIYMLMIVNLQLVMQRLGCSDITPEK